MGSGQSARKLTIANDEEVGVIKVSNAIVQRLAKGGNETADVKTSHIQTQQIPVKNSPTVTGEALAGYPVFYYPELTLTALEIQQQKEKELLNQDQYWQKRMENMEKNHAKINTILESEYKRAVNEMSSSKSGNRGLALQNAVQPCLENSNKVAKCYQEHPKETLKCSDLVDEFLNCVDQRRARIIAAH